LGTSLTDYATRLCELLESRLPLGVRSDGREDDWDTVGPAVLAAAARHLRAIIYLQTTFPSAVIVWQLVRSMFEYVATYAWVAADPDQRAKEWLKSDYVQRRKLDDDLRSLGEELLDPEQRRRVADFGLDADEMPGSLADRATDADRAWSERLAELADALPEEVRSFRRLYALIYRNGSRFTHPTSHVVAAFISGRPPELSVGDERAVERDLAMIGAAILAVGLVIACTATPALSIPVDDVRAAISE
jgi:Family of unknown function (DUF5677)